MGRTLGPTTRTEQGAAGPEFFIGTAGQPPPLSSDDEEEEPVPTEDWANSYYRVIKDRVERSAPVMVGPTYVKWPRHPADVVPKLYVDRLTSGGLSTIYQPWTPGRWFGPPAYAYQTVDSGELLVARFSLLFLSQLYTFDQFGLNVIQSTSSPASLVRCGIYRVSEKTLLPTVLLANLGTIPTLSSGIKTANISPAIALQGTLGLVLQIETGSLTYPRIWTDQSASSGAGFSWYGTDQPSSLVTGGFAQNGYGLWKSTGLVAGSLPVPSAWSYSDITYNGCGLMLRRAP